MKGIEDFQKIIGYNFTNTEYLLTALTHSSYVNENKTRINNLRDNERLEFLGDAIIEFYVSDYLFKQYADSPEGDLTKVRASMVCEQSLAKCARAISLGKHLFMGKGEEMSGGRERDSIISDAFEALTAAIFLDAGAESAKKFIHEHLIASLSCETLFFDAKTRLQELVQKVSSGSLNYELISEDGPSHNKCFVMAAFVDNKEIGRGTGHSKKAAQQEAALKAIKWLEGRKSI